MTSLAATKPRDSRIFERQPEDWYVEPAWIWERLFERFRFEAGTDVLDPACGMGTAVQVACMAGLNGRGSDIVPRWESPRPVIGQYEIRDCFEAMKGGARVVASNPPFKLALEFAQAAIAATPIVYLVLPAKWTCGDARARWLNSSPLSDVLFLCPRPSMLPGANLLAGESAGGGTTDYAVFCWRDDHIGPPAVGWLHRNNPRERRP